MRIFSDPHYESMSREEVKAELLRINEFKKVEDKSPYIQLYTLKKFQRSRRLMLWHDTSTISGHSYLLMMVKVLFDKALFYTSQEYENIFNEKLNIQKEVEKPIIYLIGRF